MSQNSLVLPTTGTVSGLQQTQNINNALDTLSTLSSGASSPSSPEAGQFWHDTTNNLIKIRSLDNASWIPLFALNETAYSAVPANQKRNYTSAGINYYVNGSTGNDGNTGLSSGTAFATIQRAVNVALGTVDTGDENSVVINVADGTYTSGVTINGPMVGAGSMTIQGNIATPSNCVISTTSADCISVNNSSIVTVQGFKLQTTTGGNCINVGQNGQAQVSTMVFGSAASGFSHMLAAVGGIITLTGNYTISGSADFHLFAQAGGLFGATGGYTVTLTGTPAFVTFAISGNLSSIILTSMTYSGAATGTRYGSSVNSIIQTNGAGANYFPGNVAGSVSNGGLYV